MQGAGLGPEGEGIMNPLIAKTKNDKTGLGCDPEVRVCVAVCVAVRCSVLQCVAVCCSVLQCV